MKTKMNDIFNGVTSLQELKEEHLKGGYHKMVKPETDDFNETDELQVDALNFWKYKEQNEVIGKFLRNQEGQYGDVAVLEVAGEEVFIPNVAALKTKLANLKEGNRVKIVYKGEVKAQKGGRMYGNFRVYIKEK